MFQSEKLSWGGFDYYCEAFATGLVKDEKTAAAEAHRVDGHERTCPNRPHTAAEETEPCILCSLPIPVSKMNAHVNACLDKA